MTQPKDVRVITYIPGQNGYPCFAVFVAIGTTPKHAGRSRVEVRLFEDYHLAVKAGQEMIFQSYTNVSVYRAEP